MKEEDLSLKQRLVIGGVTFVTGIAAMIGLYLYASKLDKTQSIEDQNTPKINEIDYLNYNFIATVYQSIKDSNDIVIKFNDDFYKAEPIRAARNGEGVLAELNRDAWTKYGTNLSTRVLERLGKYQILRQGDPLYDLKPTERGSREVLNTQYRVIGAFGTNHTLFGEVTELTDLVKQN